FTVKWGAAEFKTMTFFEQFEKTSEAAQTIASTADGTPIAYEKGFGKGSAIVLGSFAGQENYRSPASMHPLCGLLAKWAGLSESSLRAPALVELRQMTAPKGRLVFLFNHGEKSAQVRFSRVLERPAVAVRELMTNHTVQAQGTQLRLDVEVPAESVRVYRIDY